VVVQVANCLQKPFWVYRMNWQSAKSWALHAATQAASEWPAFWICSGLRCSITE